MLSHDRGRTAMFGLGFQELVVVLVIALVLFGGNKLPEVGAALGQAIREFKRATTESIPLEVKPAKPSELQSTNSSSDQDPQLRT
jgi:sec-independent protein translocase protein TatA